MSEPAPLALRPPRIDSLTGLRWWAAFGVFAYHMINLAPIPIYNFLRFGDYGVMFFFVLSGFVLTWSADTRTSAPTFWWRRFSRIYPSHFVALLLAIPVFYSFDPDPAQPWVKPVSIGILFLSVLVIQGWWTDPTVLFSGNPAAWTLTCEAFFYALHPAINAVLRRIGLRTTLLIGSAIILGDFGMRVVVTVWPHSFVGALPLPISTLSEFVLGMCVAHAMRLGWRPTLRPIVVYVLGAAFMIWVVLSPTRFDGGAIGNAIRVSTNEWMIVLCVALIAVVASRDLRGGRSLLRTRPLVKLGEWSFAFYLVHATVLYFVLAIVGHQPVSWANLGWYALILVLAIGLTLALHYLVEKPLERRLRGWWDRRLERKRARALDASGGLDAQAS